MRGTLKTLQYIGLSHNSNIPVLASRCLCITTSDIFCQVSAICIEVRIRGGLSDISAVCFQISEIKVASHAGFRDKVSVRDIRIANIWSLGPHPELIPYLVTHPGLASWPRKPLKHLPTPRFNPTFQPLHSQPTLPLSSIALLDSQIIVLSSFL